MLIREKRVFRNSAFQPFFGPKNLHGQIFFSQIFFQPRCFSVGKGYKVKFWHFSMYMIMFGREKRFSRNSGFQSLFGSKNMHEDNFLSQIAFYSCDLSELLTVRKLHFCTKDANAQKPVRDEKDHRSEPKIRTGPDLRSEIRSEDF